MTKDYCFGLISDANAAHASLFSLKQVTHGLGTFGGSAVNEKHEIRLEQI